MSNKKTDFGFEKVSEEEKTQRVRGVFDSVASNYDLMNDLMSLGIHRLWKRVMIETTGVRLGHKVLDLAGGTGDISRLLLPRVGKQGQVIISDINHAMLVEGQDRLWNKGVVGSQWVQANGQKLPFIDNYFDCVTIAMGLRNITDKKEAMQAVYRVLKPGGRFVILEFSKLTNPLLQKAYDLYSFNVLPVLGKLIVGDADSYRYLAESIQMHPDQESLLNMLKDCGYINGHYDNMTAGIVAIHSCQKPL